MKKRHWFKKSSVIFSAVVSIAAPTGKGLLLESKPSKPCKKSKAPLSSLADGSDTGDASPPFRDEPTYADTSANGCCAMPVANRSGESQPVSQQSAGKKALPLAERYPWKTKIHTTVFWIGEQPTPTNPTPNCASSWDAKWAQNYGGYDNPDPSTRRGFLPAFTPRQNPFYIALPYNDVSMSGHKEEAKRIIPWFQHEKGASRYKSTCKGRWIAIRKGDRVCYAQWEDAGPFTTTDGDYVFGNARPKAEASNGAGLDVSPAVRDYLGLDGHDNTDWKFVEFEEVPLGPWAEHGDNNDFVMKRRAAEKNSVAQTGSSSRRSTKTSAKARNHEG